MGGTCYNEELAADGTRGPGLLSWNRLLHLIPGSRPVLEKSEFRAVFPDDQRGLPAPSTVPKGREKEATAYDSPYLRYLTHFIVTTTLWETCWLLHVQTRVIWIQRGLVTYPRLPSLVAEESGWKQDSLQSPGMLSAECCGLWTVGKGRDRHCLVFRNGLSGLGFWLMNGKPPKNISENFHLPFSNTVQGLERRYFRNEI